MSSTPQRIAGAACLVIGLFMNHTGCRKKYEEGLPAGAIGAAGREQQVTRDARGHLLTNTGVWSPNGEWIAYDTRSDPAGERFDGSSIEAVNARSGEVRELYHSINGAHCGVVTWHPREEKVVFILGPDHPTADWQYCAWHRQGIIVRADDRLAPKPGPGPRTFQSAATPQHLDARDLTPPFTPGALRGGSHVHVWDATGGWVSFTYEDHVLAQFQHAAADQDINLRNVGVSAPFGPVHVSKDHPRNHDGEYFSVLVTRTTPNPKPGSDEINKACEEGWVGTNGYLRPDGTRQRRALAFQGHVVSAQGATVAEVFIVDLPEVLHEPGQGPLAGTETRMPCPPKGCAQRRLTFTTDRAFPGIQGPRHWLRCSPDGTSIAFLMKDENGIVQLWTVSPNGGAPRQVTRNPWNIASAFTWSPDGKFIAHVMDNSVCVTDVDSGNTSRLTPKTSDVLAPRPEACVFSPDGKGLAYVRQVGEPGHLCNQVFVFHFE